MKSHSSLIWRVSLIYAALTLVSLAVLAYFLAVTLPHQAQSTLEAQRDQAQLAAGQVAPYLSNPDGLVDSTTLERLSLELSRTAGTRVTIISADGLVLADSSRNPGSGRDLAVTAGQAEVIPGESSIRIGPEPVTLAAPVFAGEELVGFVSLEMPTPGTGNPQFVLFGALAVWGLVACALAVIAAQLLARSSSRSLGSVRAVTQASRQLEQGDFDSRVPSGVYPETRQLTDSFNQMADTVKGTIGRLSAERDTLSAVLATMADGVIVSSPTGHVTLLNPAARELLGIGDRQIEGSRLLEIVRDNEIHGIITRCLEENSRQLADISLILPLRYLSAIATPLDNNGGVLLTLHDLTRMRQVETSQKEFVSNVSHELRNPMASIKAMVETLESGAVKDSQVALDFLGRMRGDVDRINALVNDLLELSRMESGQFTIETEPLVLANLVHSVQKQFSQSALSQEVAIVTEVGEDLPRVMADGEKLAQVFVNLVENSLKFTPAKGTISIRAQAENEYVQIQLRDNGIGVAPQHLPHLFERFYKVNRSRRDSGTGLGLAIVKQLVEAHGGRITVDSKEGEGCAFTFTVPRAT